MEKCEGLLVKWVLSIEATERVLYGNCEGMSRAAILVLPVNWEEEEEEEKSVRFFAETMDFNLGEYFLPTIEDKRTVIEETFVFF